MRGDLNRLRMVLLRRFALPDRAPVCHTDSGANIVQLKFHEMLHAAMRNSTATRELTADLRGTG
jgi:hypothetical protein